MCAAHHVPITDLGGGNEVACWLYNSEEEKAAALKECKHETAYSPSPRSEAAFSDYFGNDPPTPGRSDPAVDGISFDVFEGKLWESSESRGAEIHAVRSISQLHKPTGGSVIFNGIELTTADSKTMLAARRISR